MLFFAMRYETPPQKIERNFMFEVQFHHLKQEEGGVGIDLLMNYVSKGITQVFLTCNRHEIEKD